MMDLKDKTCCVIESGIFQSLAHRLARDFGKVYYYRHTERVHPVTSDIEPGKGYDDIEAIEHWSDVLEEVDLWVCPDIHDGHLQEHLVSIGERVFGSRRAEDLEIWRAKFREIMDEIGLPVPPHEVVTGLDALRERLMEVNDKFIKTSANVRGTSETWHHLSYNLSQAHLDKLASQFGAFRETQEWLIDDPILNVPEIGYDGLCVDGKFPRHGIVGVEAKDKAYYGQFMPWDMMPRVIRDVNTKLAPVLGQYGYRGFFSTEIRGKYLLEPTCRQPSPAGECEQEIYSNISEMIWSAAEGEIVEPIPAARFCAQVILSSHEMDEATPLPIDIPLDRRQWVKLYNSSKGEDGQEWVSPTPTRMSEIGSIVGIGNTPEQAIRELEKHCDGYESWAMRLEIDLEALHEARKEMSKAA